jgi:hypothetical protein
VILAEGAALNGGRDLAGLSWEDVQRLAVTHEPLRELLRYAISEDYFMLREKLGTAIASAAAA